MIVKPREFPIQARKLQALLRRMPENHPKMNSIQDTLGRTLVGYRGELQVDYQTNHLPEADYQIFHDLRLPGRHSFFQIDTLLLSKKVIITLEIKNISGTLLFDQNFHQLIRMKGGEEEGFSDPLSQTYRHKLELKHWLEKNRLPSIPIVSLVVISNPYSIIKSTGSSKYIIPKDYIIQKIPQFEYAYHTEVLTDKELKKMARSFLKQHTTNFDSILTRFDIHPSILKIGAHCPACDYLPIVKTYGSWFCPSCSKHSKNAHIPSLEDYFFLFRPGITNKEARNFLRLDKSYTVTRLLKRLNLTKDKKCYLLSYPINKIG